jgi:hypothetical protein
MRNMSTRRPWLKRCRRRSNGYGKDIRRSRRAHRSSSVRAVGQRKRERHRESDGQAAIGKAFHARAELTLRGGHLLQPTEQQCSAAESETRIGIRQQQAFVDWGQSNVRRPGRDQSSRTVTETCAKHSQYGRPTRRTSTPCFVRCSVDENLQTREELVAIGVTENLHAALDEARHRLAEAQRDEELVVLAEKAREAAVIAEKTAERGTLVSKHAWSLCSELRSTFDDARRLAALGAPTTNERSLRLALTRTLLAMFRDAGLDVEMIAPGERHQADELIGAFAGRVT